MGTTSNADRTAFHPYFSFKDLVTVYLFFVLFTLIVFYAPDKLGHSDNYIEANSMQTPASIIINKVSVFVLLIYTFYLVFKFKLKMN